VISYLVLAHISPLTVPQPRLILLEELREFPQQIHVDISEESLYIVYCVCVNLLVKICYERLLLFLGKPKTFYNVN